MLIEVENLICCSDSSRYFILSDNLLTIGKKERYINKIK